MQNTRRVRIQYLIALHLLKGRQQHVGFLPRLRTRRLNGHGFGFLLFRRNRFVIRARQIFAIRMGDRINFPRRIQTRGINPTPARQGFFNNNRGVTHIADLADRLPHCQAVRNFNQRALAVAEHQHIGFRIHQHRAAYGIRPVIIVRGTTQAGFNTAEDHRHVFPGLFTALGIDQRRTIRALARHVIRRIGVVMAQSAIGGITVDHRVHVARCDAEKQIRFPQTHKIIFAVPVRLGNDANTETLRFQHTTANRHPKARMIDIRITGNQNNVAAIPAKLIHFVA